MSITLDPIDNGQPKQESGHVGGSIGQEIRDIVAILVQKLNIIALVACVTLGLVVVYIWTTTPLFSSRVEILIDPRQRQTVESEIAPTGLGSSAAGADTLLLESQVEVLRSQKVADALIRKENLTSDPEFSGSGSTGLIGFLKILVKAVAYGPQTSLWRQHSAYDRALTTLRKRMEVERQRNTYVIGVTVKSSSSKKAARLANRVAEIYISEINGAASTTTTEAATLLTSKLEELQRSATQAALAVEAYKKKNNLINTNETLVVEQQLSDLNRELSQARTELQTALARRNQVRAVLNNDAGVALSLSEVGESTVMSQLQTRLAELESQEADLRSVYLASHPTLKRLKERKLALNAALRREHARILSRLEVTYKTALEKSSSLKAAVDKLEAQVAASNSDSVQLRELERVAKTSRTLYETFLRRSKEAWEQVDIPNSTARIISPAFAASRPSEPKVFFLLVSGLAFGLVLGIVVAFLHNVLVGRPKRVDAAAHGETDQNAAQNVTILQKMQNRSAEHVPFSDGPRRGWADHQPTRAPRHNTWPGRRAANDRPGSPW